MKNWVGKTRALKCHLNGVPRKLFSIEFKDRESGAVIDALFQFNDKYDHYKDQTSIFEIHRHFVWLYWDEVRKPILKLIKDPETEGITGPGTEYAYIYDKIQYSIKNPSSITWPSCSFPHVMAIPCNSPCQKFGYSEKWCFSGWKLPHFIIPHSWGMQSSWLKCQKWASCPV